MHVDYERIREEHKHGYGAWVGEWAPTLLPNLYGNRTHFIFEILQNTEDALAKRIGWQGQRSVEFRVASSGLTISHFGKPFDEADVCSICKIAKSNKDVTDIGTFGIGFKSVYAYTDCPEIHSGLEHFAIETYVFPKAVDKRTLQAEETQIYISFREGETSAAEEILKALQGLDMRVLLFLHEIDEISWSFNGEHCGSLLRREAIAMGHGARKVELLRRIDGQDDVEEEWLVFSREVFHGYQPAGCVELAFKLVQDNGSAVGWAVEPAVDFPLVVFFPTVLQTNLGFVVQGPYVTTPSRDNVPQDNHWNQHLADETATLLYEALEGLRQFGLLDVSAIECLPLDKSRFPENSRFYRLFEAVKQAFVENPLLPAYNGEHVAAGNAKLARTQELRQLISPEQLASLFSSDGNPLWLSDEITVNRTPALHKYLTTELEVEEVTPEVLVRKLTKGFLAAQSDEWMGRFYAFLADQRALRIRLQGMPIIRLEDGAHVAANDKHQAYLPGDRDTGFPTVKRVLCQEDQALEFLKALGLRVADPVDDVIANVLPKYAGEQPTVSDSGYRRDLRRMANTLANSTSSQRDILLGALRKARFVMARDAGSGARQFMRPAEVYLATERLTSLFEGVSGVFFIDNEKLYPRDDQSRNLLQTAGVSRYLARIPIRPTLTDQEKSEFRHRYGSVGITSEKSVEDYTLKGLAALLSALATLPADQARDRARLLWLALCDLQDRMNKAFVGRYQWKYRLEYVAEFPAHFVHVLNEAAWVPDRDGMLQQPRAVLFKDTEWPENASLQQHIQFKPYVLDQLAEEIGIDVKVLTFLQHHGLTSIDAIRARTGIKDDTRQGLANDPQEVETQRVSVNSVETNGSLSHQEHSAEGVQDDSSDVKGQPASSRTAPAKTTPAASFAERAGDGQKRTMESVAEGVRAKPSVSREFVSYVRVSVNDAADDMYGLTHEERLTLEDKAIGMVLSAEPYLQRTPPNNPGFDLVEFDPQGVEVRWVEVKGMSGTLKDRPATLSNTQFEFAQKHGQAFWLYIVESAANHEESRIIRIKDPAGKASAFTFDHGWAEVAEDAYPLDPHP